MHRSHRSRAHGLAFCLVTALLATAAEAGQDRWTPFGRGGGEVLSLATDPAVAGVVYAAAGYAGIFRSDDAAHTWRWRGATASSGEWTSVLVDPGDPLRLYATARYQADDGGVYTSADGGLHWEVLFRLPGGFFSVAVSPNGTLLATTVRSEVYRSVDGGLTWTRVVEEGFSTTPPLRVTADPLTPGTAWAWGERLLRSTDDGATWTLVGPLPGGQQVEVLSALAVSGTRPGFLYALIRGLLYRSEDGGLTWSAGTLSVGENSALQASLAIDPADPRTVYASGETVQVSHDGGATAAELTRPPSRGPFRSYFSPLAVSPAAPATLYAAVFEEGVAVSRDAGEHWTLSEQRGLSANLPTIFFLDFYAAPSGRLYHQPIRGGAGGGKFLRSLDRGRSWSPLAPIPGLTPYDLTEEAGDPDSLWAATSERLYHSTDGGASWKAVWFATYVASPSPGVVLAGSCGVQRSLDGGRTWVDVVPCTIGRGNDRTFYIVNRLGTAPGWPGAVWAEVETTTEGPLILFSQNSGRTWHILARRISSPRGAHAVAASQGVIYLNRGRALQRSDNGGARWESRPAGFVIQSIAVDAANPDVVYAATEDRGVLRSTDGGRTWSPTAGLAGVGRLWVHDVVADPKFPGTAFAFPGLGGTFQAHFGNP
jgi:photosystem II stability/assembly factor-like uncharacterized protein